MLTFCTSMYQVYRMDQFAWKCTKPYVQNLLYTIEDLKMFIRLRYLNSAEKAVSNISEQFFYTVNRYGDIMSQ